MKADGNQIKTQKLKDRFQKLKRISYEANCPYFAYFLPCANLIHRDWCCYKHNFNVRTANEYQTSQILKEQAIDNKAIDIIIRLNANNEKEIASNFQLLKKFPEYPTNQTKEWLNTIKQNPKKADAWENYV